MSADNMRNFTRKLALAAALVAVVGATGCHAQDWDDPAFVSEQIRSGDRLKAYDKAAKLPEAKQRELVPALVEVYNKDIDKDGSFKLLAVLRDERAKMVYVDALQKAPSSRDKGAAAVALGDLNARDQIKTMVQVFRDVPNEDVRRSILEAFKAMPDPSERALMVDILTNYDPDRESIAYHAFACEVLALIEPTTDAQVEAVVYGMYLDNAKGQNVFKQCASAVFATQKKATPVLLSVLDGTHPKVFKRYQKFPSYVQLTAEIKAVDVLGHLHDPAASDKLLAEVTKVRVAPSSYRNDKLLAWGQNRIQLYVYAMGALADIGSPKLIDVAKPILSFDKKAYAPYADMIDYDKRAKHDVVLAALDGLNKVGDRKALPVLAQCIKDCDIPELKGFDEKFVGQARWEAAQQYARLTDASGVAAYEKALADEKTDYVKEKLVKFKPMVDAAKECDGNIDCWAKMLNDKDPLRAEKAAWELGRGAKGGAAETALLGGLKGDNLALRKVVIHSLFRVGTKAAAEKVKTHMTADRDKRGMEWKDIAFRMNSLYEFLRHAS